ncbi:hypothetical protein B7C62_01945 [Kitasatospora albolonga]|uniref:Uncharacterized protein n=1 Tax=Kitasatospora albolonga TaxID=68173 RepID=A0ABC8BLH5_9ACTN|nr:hypothetical protein B7C62_01945 [Kitasatospora albolonga]
MLFGVAEYRDRQAVKAGAPKAPKGVLPIRWTSAGVIVLASVAGTVLGGYAGGGGFHVTVFVLGVGSSFLPLLAVTRFLGRVPGTAVVLALGLSAGVFSFQLAASFK